MGLREYKRKRHFQRTPEPAGKQARKVGWSFVVQKHHASHLHYDFRLELDGVLKSWAVPKGPSLDPSVKRLAMHVEDHPVEYGTFEGIIPEGEYGGGTVMVWDRGRWEPVGDAAEGYRTGKLKFQLHGEKLKGGWMLLRTGGGSSEKDQRRWLLFKERDDEAKSQEDGDVVEESPLSVASGRTLEEIKADRDHVWGSDGKASGKRSGTSKPVRPTRRRKVAVASVLGKKARKLPTRAEVQLATLVKEAPEGEEWFHEIKLDGYRMLCRVDKGHAKFISRNQQDWTRRLSKLAEAAAELPVTQALFDGEVVALRPDGTTNFQDLQNAFRDRRADMLQYYVFDVLHIDGHDLTNVPFQERKRLLGEVLTGPALPTTIRLSEHMEGNGPAFFKEACKLKLEGIISKRRDRPYLPGRGYDWLKVKCMQHEEFVIGAFTEPTGSRTGFGALLLGYHNREGELVYAGKVGTGFNEKVLQSLFDRLKSLEQEHSPFVDRKRRPGKVHWVEPTLVAQVSFGAWTNDGLLRHPSFQGLREDKPADEVTRDQAVPLSKAVGKSKGIAIKAPHARNGSSENGKGTQRSGRKRHATLDSSDEYDARLQQFAGVRLTSPDKILYPDAGVTKLELATYYQAIADWILPHIADRPLVLVRCPEGQEKACFYQKHPAAGTPDTLRRIPVREKSKTEDYVIADDVSALISLAQISALEIHAWGSRADKLEQPDRLIFDLDPDIKVPWSRVVQSARQLREFLQELGLESFLKTTGGKGLHLVVPIDRRHDWDEAKDFCSKVTDAVVVADPRHYTANMSKAARSGKIFVDYLRNGRGATAIIPYSPRARPGAPVSVPLAWKELNESMVSDRFTVRTVGKRLASLQRDPWEGIGSMRQGLAGPLAKLRALHVS